jgi:NAD(P)H-flavin reductase
MASDTALWRPARILANRPVSDGAMWLTLEAIDDLPAAYEPGHVLGLGLKVDSGYIRHAYTVSRGEARTRKFEHLYRVISQGRLTPRLSRLPVGASLFFHGPFHTPIQREIRPAAERIILIATGTGVGPIFGYAEKALSDGETRPMTLYGGFREESHVCLADDLEMLARRHANFEWHYTVTNPSTTWQGYTGRVTDWIPDEIGRHGLQTHHFHLVGNGDMVHLVRKALLRVGVLPERVSIETYFNHHAEPQDVEIDRLALRLCGRPLA